MLHLKKGITSLFRKVTTSLPPDVEKALRDAAGSEAEGKAKNELLTVLNGVEQSRSQKSQLCEDTGVPFFYVNAPKGLDHAGLREVIIEATREATAKIPLPANATDPITGQSSSDGTGTGFPVIYIEETTEDKLTIELMLLGTSSESLGRMYTLPDEDMGADLDMNGIKTCVLDTVKRAGGKGCPPYIIGVGLGPTRDRAAWLSKQQLRRKLDDTNPMAELAKLEADILKEANALGIGPKGGTTALGVKIDAHHRHPATAYLDITLLCWNTRRGKLIW